MSNLLVAALLPLVVAAACLEASGSCASSSQALLQSSKSHQFTMDDASQGGLQPLVLMLQEGGAQEDGARQGGGPGASKTSELLLRQIQSRVEAIVQEDKPLSPLEGSLMQALNETLSNTTLPALKKGHADDQKEMNQRVQALTNCNKNYAIDSKSAASAKQLVDAEKDSHQQCRGNQSVLKVTRSKTWTSLKSFIDSLQQPQKPGSLVPTDADSYFAAGLQWFRDKQTLYTEKKSAYTAAKEEHDNKTETCNELQTRYESGYCQWIGQGTAASKSYTRCWKQGGGNGWKQTLADVLDSSEQRKLEYVAVKTIQCYLSSLLVLATKAGKVTRKSISACKALTPDTSIFDLVNTNAPPKQNLTSLGNLTSMPGDGSWQKSEYAQLSDVKNATPCAHARDDNDTLIWKDGNVTHLCDAYEHVRMHRCEACAHGKSHPEGDNAIGPDTECSAIICSADEHVKKNVCLECPAGKTRTAGDDASKANTSCTAILCVANQRVISNACVNCPAGKTNAPGDDASGGNTTCDAILCAENQHVQAHACHTCTAGKTNRAGDDASASDTMCKAIKCLRNQQVKSNACHTCAAGKTNAAGDDASLADTHCTATKCSANKKVVSNECKGCPPGKTNRAGDDASSGDTTCDAVKCQANQHVQGNACKACPDGTTNAAGDDASGSNTKCDAIKCGANQRVLSKACTSCPFGTNNAAGDDASGSDTSCDRTCALYSCPNGYVKKNQGFTFLSLFHCCQQTCAIFNCPSGYMKKNSHSTVFSLGSCCQKKPDFQVAVSRRECGKTSGRRWLGAWKYSTVAACWAAVSAQHGCSKKYFNYAIRGDKNCGCVYNSGNCLDHRNTWSPHAVDVFSPVFKVVVSGRECGKTSGRRWLGAWKYNSVAECFAAVSAHSGCSKQYFNYAIRGDRNCGCVYNSGNCMDHRNQFGGGTVDIFKIPAR